MRKYLWLLLILVLAACGSSTGGEEKPKEDKGGETTAEKNIVEEPEPTTTFENGTLETDKFTLKIAKTEIIQSPMESNPGLFVTFKLTNKTQDEDVIPNETLGFLMARQENETSRIDLMDNYHFLDAFGDEDDVETYNKMVDLDNASANALLPGKSIEFVEAYGLDNDQYDVVFTGYDDVTATEVGEYTVKLK